MRDYRDIDPNWLMSAILAARARAENEGYSGYPMRLLLHVAAIRPLEDADLWRALNSHPGNLIEVFGMPVDVHVGTYLGSVVVLASPDVVYRLPEPPESEGT